ncbi:PREDICTED: uncharacterized protein LOC106810948 [Priapulus caudatus]|uniref:Uncharacterized protein LOC106810948 n=1 Tax=Priapulus caudatus TaxID=37621 RepID=A0ABM1ECJ4_PRICU|nr:PREDICTED: uncharacterized protein LOC106810948 [Priapulus caudatus]
MASRGEQLPALSLRDKRPNSGNYGSAYCRLPIIVSLASKRFVCIRVIQYNNTSTLAKYPMTKVRHDYTVVVVVTTTPPVLTITSRAYEAKCKYVLTGKANPSTRLTVDEIPVISITKQAKPTNLSLKIFDVRGREVIDVNLGQKLMLTAFVSDGYGVFVRNCDAVSTRDLSASLQLRRAAGMSGDHGPSVGTFRPLRTGNGAVAVLESFKFPGADTVVIECEVEACLGRCRSVACGKEGQSYGRRKRELEEVWAPPIKEKKITTMWIVQERSPREGSPIANTSDLYSAEASQSAPAVAPPQGGADVAPLRTCVTENTLAVALVATGALAATLTLTLSCLVFTRLARRGQHQKEDDEESCKGGGGGSEGVGADNWTMRWAFPLNIMRTGAIRSQRHAVR